MYVISSTPCNIFQKLLNFKATHPVSSVISQNWETVIIGSDFTHLYNISSFKATVNVEIVIILTCFSVQENFSEGGCKIVPPELSVGEFDFVEFLKFCIFPLTFLSLKFEFHCCSRYLHCQDIYLMVYLHFPICYVFQEYKMVSNRFLEIVFECLMKSNYCTSSNWVIDRFFRW